MKEQLKLTFEDDSWEAGEDTLTETAEVSLASIDFSSPNKLTFFHLSQIIRTR